MAPRARRSRCEGRPRTRRLAGRTLLVAAATLALVAPRAARACSVCGCGDPLLTSSDPAAIAGVLRLQLDTEYLRVDAGNEDDPALRDELTQWSYRLNAVYRPADRLSLTVTLPLVSKAIRTVGAGGPVPGASATGLGDVELGARWVLWRSVDLGKGRVHELAATGGTSAPTGPNDVRAGGERIEEHAQPGTGAWGPFAGIAYRFEQGSWLAFGSVSGRAHSENGDRYRYGPAALWSLHAQFFPVRRLALDLGVDGRWAAADELAGEAVVNTGGTVLAAAPGAYWNALGDAWLFVRAQLPFAKALRGDQDQLPSVVTGFQLQVF